MINEEVTGRILALMRELADLDLQAVRLMIETRVPCNYALATHPTVQVRRVPADNPLAQVCTYEVGLLGILNGLCGAYDDGPKAGWGPIAAVVEEDGSVRFERTLNETGGS